MSIGKLQNPKVNQLVDTVNALIDQKQDVLTAGEGINIAASVDYDVINGWEYESYSQISVKGLAYGNNKFVKMTNLGATYLSDDGSSWSSGGPLGGIDWQNLAFGYNSFVAINFSGSIAYSSSGSTWVVTSASDTGLGSNYWTGITYGNGKYVVIGATGYVSTSVNGSIWTTPVQNTNLGNNDWQSITYFDNKFVAISSQGYVATSYDGVNWSVATQNANLGNNDWRMISHTNTQLFAISKYGYVSTSKDGENWSIATQNSVLSASGQYWQRVACSNSIMIAVTYMNYTCKNEPTNVTLISTVGGGGGSSTDVQINGTSITNNNVANIVTNTSYDASSNKIATMSDLPTESTVSGWGFTKNAGTITGITMNGSSKGTSGVVDLGTVITAHQDISGKVDKTSIVSTVSSSSTNSQVVGAKLFYDTCGDIETALNTINSGSST